MTAEGPAYEEMRLLYDEGLRLYNQEHPSLAMRVAATHRPGRVPRHASSPFIHAVSICSIVTFDDGSRAQVQFPLMNMSRLRLGQANNEPASNVQKYDQQLLMKYLAPRIQHPVPEILGIGRWRYGLYIVTGFGFADGIPLSLLLEDPSGKTPGLRPDVSDATLARAYRVMANVLLDVSKLKFPLIGSISYVPAQWRQIDRGLLSEAMHDFVNTGGRPLDMFLRVPASFSTANKFFEWIGREYLQFVPRTRDAAVADAEGLRRKFVASCLFSKIARDELVTEAAPFRLYCAKLSPYAVRVASETDFTVTAIMDWQDTMSAPVEYSYAAPWWLLLEPPEAWEHDLHGFLERCRPRLALFVEVLEGCEEERRLDSSDRLSARMAQSLDNGVFWLCLAAGRPLMFESIYWNCLDPLFFGEFETLDQRLELLTRHQRDQMEAFVRETLARREPHPEEQAEEPQTEEQTEVPHPEEQTEQPHPDE